MLKTPPRVGLLRVIYSNGRYSLPPAWRPQETITPLYQMSVREALTTHFYSDRDEVWIYPYSAMDGQSSIVRHTKQGDPLAYERETGIKIGLTALFIDLDDRIAHKGQRDTPQEWYTAVENYLIKYQGISGFFLYRTLRGARCGIIFEGPCDLGIAQKARLELFAQLDSSLAPMGDEIEVDRACTDISRGFAAPLITKKGVQISPEKARVWMSEHDCPLALVEKLAQLYDQRRARTRESGERSPDADSPREASRGNATSRHRPKKPKILVPSAAGVAQLDGTAQYELSLSALASLRRWIHHDGLMRDIIDAFDRHLMDGRRAQKEHDWVGRTARSLDDMYPEIEDEAIIGDVPPMPAPIDEFPELLPLRRVYERSDDVELADAILECFGDSPRPLWHGDGIRKYDEKSGVWKLYSHHALRRIAFQAAGAQTLQGREVAISSAKTKGAIEVIASKAGADQISPFDLAPAGVVVGAHHVSYDLDEGLRIETPKPEHLSIHRLDYDLPVQVLKYWESDGDEGSSPRRPSIFCDHFLARSLARSPDEGETQQDIDEEIKQKITTIGEWIGLALLGACTMEATALVVHGRGSNGKSVLTSMITDLFGPDRTCHLPPQHMSERFSRAQLFGAAVNVVSEMPESELLASDTLKAVISGDRIEVERKHRDPFQFRPRAAHIFAANNLPSSRDRSHGLWRRLVPIEFHRIFSGLDRDRGLLDKLRAEYDLIVPWCLDLAREYFLRGGYAYTDSIEKWRMVWRVEVDSVAAFAADKLISTSTSADGESVHALWQAFLTWCEDHGQHGSAKMSLKAFSRQICALPDVERGRHGKERETRINKAFKPSTKKDEWGVA